MREVLRDWVCANAPQSEIGSAGHEPSTIVFGGPVRHLAYTPCQLGAGLLAVIARPLPAPAAAATNSWAYTPQACMQRSPARSITAACCLQDGYGTGLDRANVCYDTSKTVVVMITDSCERNEYEEATWLIV